MESNQSAIKNGVTSKFLIEHASSAAKVAALPTFEKIRATATKKISACHEPQSNDELWRQTRPELFPWRSLKNPVACSPIVFGFKDGHKSGQFPKGVVFSSGESAITQNTDLFDRVLNTKIPDLSSDWISNVHLASLSSVCVLTVTKGTKVAEPILLSDLIPENGEGSSASLVILNIESNATVTILEDLDSKWQGFAFQRIECLVGSGANVQFISVQRLGESSSYLARHGFHLEKDAELNTRHLVLGAKVSRIDMDLNLNGSGATANMLAVSIADGKRHIDFHPTQRHVAANCRSDLFSKNVIRDASRSVYYGYIRVAPGAQKTDAYQTNRNLVLSTQGRADSIPNLEIKANDVKCSHGASVGHMNSEDMFYLMSRGLSRASAERILVEGFLEDAISRVKEAWIHDWFQKLLIERVDNSANGHAA